MKTTAWRTASRSGLTPSSGGIRGKTAAPSGTGLSASSAISASGHRGNDAQFIAVLDCRGQVIEVTDVLIVQVDVDEAANLATLEDPLLDGGKLTAQIVERCLHRGAARVHCCLPVGMLPHRCGNMNTYGHDTPLLPLTGHGPDRASEGPSLARRAHGRRASEGLASASGSCRAVRQGPLRGPLRAVRQTLAAPAGSSPAAPDN